MENFDEVSRRIEWSKNEFSHSLCAQANRRFAFGSFAAAVMAISFLTGCVGAGSTTLPPRLLASEKAQIRGAHLPYTVGVERDEFPAYSDALLSVLRKTKLFDRVDYLDQFSTPPSLVAAVEERVYGSTVIPVNTLLTFGVVPTATPETFGYVFSLRSPHGETQRVVVDYRYRAHTTLGWAALFRALSPDEVLSDPESHTRFLDQLRLAILKHSEDLSRVTTPNP